MLSFIIILFINVFAFSFLLFEKSNVPKIIMDDQEHFGNWAAILLSIALFSFFTLSFLVPMKKMEWRTAGVYEAFIIALFTEMFGFPLSIFILSLFIGAPFQLGHEQGHMLATLFATLGIMSLENGVLLIMAISSSIMAIGFILIMEGWRKIYGAKGELVTGGFYRYIRHPQYLGLIIITAGLLIQWPTLITLIMWPILTLMYYRLAKKEEKELEEKFGITYLEYKQKVPMFLPFLSKEKPSG